MKILILSKFFNFVGGAEIHVQLLARELTKSGHDVTIVTQASDEDSSFSNGIKVKGVDYGDFRTLTESVSKLIKKYDADIVHCHDSLSVIAADSIRRSFDFPLVFTTHGLITFRPEDRKMQVADFLAPTIKVDAVIAVSNFAAGELRKVGFQEDTINLIYNGVDTERFNPIISGEEIRRSYGVSNEPLILCAARLSPEKGVDVLIDAIPEVLKIFPEAKFMITGNGSAPITQAKNQDYKRLVNDRGIQSSVFFAGGKFSYFDMPKVYNAADIVVVASRYGEMFGMAAVEAMACARPVIASNVCALPEVVGSEGSGLFFKSEDSSDLALKICQFLSNPDQWESLGMKARKRVMEKFNVERMSVETLELYEKVRKTL